VTLILALETATTACSAALCDAHGVVLAEALTLHGPAHAQRLLPGVHEVLTEADKSWAEIGTIAVSLGPGAFTGLRIGIATARSLAQADGDARLVGIPTAAALALALAGAPERVAMVEEHFLVPLIDGRRREVFAAAYRAEPGGASLSPVVGPVVVSADALGDWLEQLGRPVLVGGDGAVLYADRLPVSARRAESVAAPSAAMVGRATAWGVPGLVTGPDAVLPIYGRAPDAARWVGASAALGGR